MSSDDNGARNGSVDISKLTVPIISIVAVVGALLGGVMWIQTSISTESHKLQSSINLLSGDVQQLREKVATIEASRFTAADALDVWKHIASIKESIVRIEQRQADIAERFKSFEKKS